MGDTSTGETTSGIAADHVSAETALGFSRALSALVDAGAVLDDDSDLPRGVSWLDLHGPRLADEPAAVIERWQESRSIISGPAAPPAGRAPCRHPARRRRPGGRRAARCSTCASTGPHALVGGTTGSGKSELLQTWILAMAAAHSPQRLTFLLVDYKGGSAFRDCVNLPHTVGLVTDLSPHLVERAMASLSRRADLPGAAARPEEGQGPA